MNGIVNLNVPFVQETCLTCGTQFLIEQSVFDAIKHDTIKCPKGHGQFYHKGLTPDQEKIKQLEKDLKKSESSRIFYMDRYTDSAERNRRLSNTIRALKGHLTRIRNHFYGGNSDLHRAIEKINEGNYTSAKKFIERSLNTTNT